MFHLGSTVFYPSDAVSCERAVELAANTKGICFIRTSRPNTAVIYKNDDSFQVSVEICKIKNKFIYLFLCYYLKTNYQKCTFD